MTTVRIPTDAEVRLRASMIGDAEIAKQWLEQQLQAIQLLRIAQRNPGSVAIFGIERQRDGSWDALPPLIRAEK